VEHSDPLHKVSIIPRGRALGITFQLPEKDMYTVDSRFVLDKIAILMGGRGAELLLFNQKNTGASNDIERATELARKYVCEWGMSDLGPLSYGKKQEEIFLGREINQHRDYSEATAIQIDREVRKIIDGQMERVTGLLSQNRQKLINLAEALLVHEVLEKDEILKAMDGEMLTETRKSRSYLKGIPERRQREANAAALAAEGEFKPVSGSNPNGGSQASIGPSAEKSEGADANGEADKGKGGRFDAEA